MTTGCKDCVRYAPALAACSGVATVLALVVVLLQGLAGVRSASAMLSAADGRGDESRTLETTASITATFTSACIVAAVVASASSAVSRVTASLRQAQVAGCNGLSKERAYFAWGWAASAFATAQLFLLLWCIFVLGVMLLWRQSLAYLADSTGRIAATYDSFTETIVNGMGQVGVSPDIARAQLGNELEPSWSSNLADRAMESAVQAHRDGLRRVAGSFGVSLALMQASLEANVTVCPTAVCINTEPFRQLFLWADGPECVCSPGVIHAWAQLSAAATSSLSVALVAGVVLVAALSALTMSVYADSRAFATFRSAVFHGSFDRFAYHRVKWGTETASPICEFPRSVQMWRKLESGSAAPPPPS